MKYLLLSYIVAATALSISRQPLPTTSRLLPLADATKIMGEQGHLDSNTVLKKTGLTEYKCQYSGKLYFMYEICTGFYFFLVRKNEKMFRLKLNKITTRSSETAFKTVAKNIVDRL